MVVQTLLYSSPEDPRRRVWYVESEGGFAIHCDLWHESPRNGGVREPFEYSAPNAFAARNSLAHHMAIHHKNESAYVLLRKWEQDAQLKSVKETLRVLKVL